MSRRLLIYQRRDTVSKGKSATLPRQAAFPAPNKAPAALRRKLSEQSLAADAYLFHQGDRTNAVFAIASGIVRLERHTADGHAVVIHRARAGESLAEAALYADVYHCDAVAETPARVIVYPKDAMLALLQTDAVSAASVTAALARHVQGLRTQLELRNLQPAGARVFAYLELLADDNGNIELDRPLKELASEVGLTHETLYRALAALARTGDIVRDGRRMRLRPPGSV
jgi:CRP-like cAMP-binding protein